MFGKSFFEFEKDAKPEQKFFMKYDREYFFKTDVQLEALIPAIANLKVNLITSCSLFDFYHLVLLL